MKLWNPEYEKRFIENTNAVVYASTRCRDCSFSYQSVFKKSTPGKCPLCGGKLESSTPQGRNAPVSNYTEKFALDIVNRSLKELGFKDFEGKREVVCDQLGLPSRSAADIAIVERGSKGRHYTPEKIKVVFEVKMSLIWNWEQDKNGSPVIIADYDSHKGRGSIYRTDSILKAIGKGAIFRSHHQASRIPYVVIGNSPPPTSYLGKVDGSVKVGIVQRFISLTPEPLVVDESKGKERNPKTSPGGGFTRIDTLDDFSDYLKSLLEEERIFIGSMLKKSELGRLIKSLDLDQDYEEIGEEFFEKLHRGGD